MLAQLRVMHTNEGLAWGQGSYSILTWGLILMDAKVRKNVTRLLLEWFWQFWDDILFIKSGLRIFFQGLLAENSTLVYPKAQEHVAKLGQERCSICSVFWSSKKAAYFLYGPRWAGCLGMLSAAQASQLRRPSPGICTLRSCQLSCGFPCDWDLSPVI